MILSLSIALVFLNRVQALDLKETEGHPVGYLSDCPGSTKEAIITNSSLKYLSLSIMTSKQYLKKYNYFQMRKLGRDPNFNFRKKTMIYVGGYLDSPHFPWGIMLAMKYKQLGYNVLLLDTNYFTTMDYPRAVRFMRPVGKHTAKMLAELTEEGLDPKTTELVGLSLGGQTSSFIGKNYKLLTGKSLSRITGLDPAGPCFRHLGPEHRLDKSDADLVDVISTNVDGFGMANPIGDVNFYVNGGEYQPGFVYWAMTTVLFSHVRSYLLWIIALDNPQSFIAVKCDSVEEARNRECFERFPQETNVLGLRTNRNNTGIFYLATSGSFPFYLGKQGLKRENDFFLSRTKFVNNDDVIRI